VLRLRALDTCSEGGVVPRSVGCVAVSHEVVRGRFLVRSKAELTALIHAQPRAVLVVNTRSRHATGQRRRLPGGLGDAGVRLLATLPVGVTGDLASTLRKGPVVGAGSAGGRRRGRHDGDRGWAAGPAGHRFGGDPVGNDEQLRRSLGVPLDVPAAVRTIAAGKVADVDLGRVDHAGGAEVFATLTSVGVSVEVARRTPHRLKRLIGPAAYAATALAVLPAHAPFQATVRTGDGRSESFFTHQLNVANGRFHAGRVIAADASIDDHQLVVYRLGGRGRGRAAPWPAGLAPGAPVPATRVRNGRHSTIPAVARQAHTAHRSGLDHRA